MSIVSSTFTIGHPQIDGRRYVIERHTDHLGVVREVEYLADVGTDYAAVMAARVPLLEQQLAEQEAESLLGN